MVVDATGINPNSVSTACRNGQLPNAKKVRASQYGNKPMWLIPAEDAKKYIRNYKNGGIGGEYEMADMSDILD